jgi:hypothetical protein
MKDFLARVGLVIHWFGFIVGGIFFATLMISGFIQSGSGDVALFFGAPVMWFVFWGMGWLIRYILSGKCDPLPYKQ